MRLCVGSLLVLLLLFTPESLAARGRFAQKLFRDLFKNYTSALRPVDNTDNVINVTLQVTLSQIIDMDERNQILTLYLWVRQVWMDSFLTWTKEDYDGLDTIWIPSRYVWKPDIVLYNSADDEFSSSMETNVVLRSDGQVTWDQPAITKSSCSVDVAFFPFDLQQCKLTFGSWTHNGNQMDLNNALETADLADLVPNVEWQVLGMPAQKNVILYGCCSDPYPDITFTLHLKRRASFYIFNLIIPCMMISFLAPLGFYLPADSGEKVSLGVTVLLALTVFQLLVAESMPPSESVPLIGKYYIATMTMVTASTALTIFIMNLHHCGPEARPVPDWVRTVVLKYLNQICLVYELGENCTRMDTADETEEETEEVNRKQATLSWEVNGDGHAAGFTAAEEGLSKHFKRDELSVTIEASENDKPITVRQVENLRKTRETQRDDLRPKQVQELRDKTMYRVNHEQEQNGGRRKVGQQVCEADTGTKEQGFRSNSDENAKNNGAELERGKQDFGGKLETEQGELRESEMAEQNGGQIGQESELVTEGTQSKSQEVSKGEGCEDEELTEKSVGRNGFGGSQEKNGRWREDDDDDDDDEVLGQGKAEGKLMKTKELPRARSGVEDDEFRSNGKSGNSDGDDKAKRGGGEEKEFRQRSLRRENEEQTSDSEDLRKEKQKGNLRKEGDCVGRSAGDEEPSRNPRCVSCHCCVHCHGAGAGVGCSVHGDRSGCHLRGDGVGCGLRGDVASIAASFQEQRAAQNLMADWRKVAKVMDRAFMWIFFIMVFIMSLLILGKAI